jgi:hypothetical protein
VSGASDVFAWSSATLATAKAVLALAGAALLALEVALRRGGRAQPWSRARAGLLVAIAVAAALAWMRFAPLGAWSHPHPWELFHHAIGAKYFRELGYTRLYDCALIADLEAGFAIPPEKRPVRRLESNRVEPGSRVAADPDACKRHFTPERWRDFQQDVAVFRDAFVQRRWGSILTDHGFNASPVWTVAGAALVPSEPLAWWKLRWLARIDLALLAATAAAGYWGFGLRAGSAAVIFFGTHYLGDSAWVGGAFLRYDWLALSVIGAALVARGHPGAGGFALTWAALVRVFPGFLVAAVVLHAAIDLARRRSLALAPAHRGFAAGCVLALAILVPLSVAVTGRDAWPGFVANSEKHLATPLLNFVGWKTVVAFDPAATAGALRDPAHPDPYEAWHAAVRERFARREGVYLAGVAAFVVLLAAALARNPLALAPLLGVGLVVVAAQIGSYYYAILLCYGLLSSRFELLGPALLLGSAASLAIADVVTGSSDVVFAAQSALWTAWVAAATALAAVQAGHGSRSQARPVASASAAPR